MGHCLSTRAFGAELTKDEILSYINEEVCEESDYHGGLYKPVRWYDGAKPFPDADGARAFLEDEDRGDYDQLAVRFYEPAERVSSEKLKGLTAKYAEAKKHASAVENEFCFDGQKRKFATCKACGSSVSVEAMGKYRIGRNVNDCPVCGEDMRPDSAKKKAEAARAAERKAYERMEAERKKLEAKAPKKLMWLVKYEYHV